MELKNHNSASNDHARKKLREQDQLLTPRERLFKALAIGTLNDIRRPR